MSPANENIAPFDPVGRPCPDYERQREPRDDGPGLGMLLLVIVTLIMLGLMVTSVWWLT